jgi:hypothetical protein
MFIPNTAPAAAKRPEPSRDHSPALTWLSLVGLLFSRAQLRFTRQREVYRNPQLIGSLTRVHP